MKTPIFIIKQDLQPLVYFILMSLNYSIKVITTIYVEIKVILIMIRNETMSNKGKKLLKLFILVLLLLILIIKWLPIIIFSISNGLMHEKFSISDYYYFHYSFETVWQNKPSGLLYDCNNLQAGLKEKYNINSSPNACFLYPPHFAVFFSWLGSFSFDFAEYIWNVFLNFIYIIGVLLFIKLIFKEKTKYNYNFTLSLVFLLSLLHYPFIFDSQMSNSNRLTFFLISIMFYLLYEKKKNFWAGISLGFAIVFKITPAIILVFYLFKRNFMLAFGAIFSIIISSIIVIITIGWNVLWKFSTDYFWGFSQKLAHFGVPYDNSIQGILSTYFPSSPITFIFIVYILLFLIVYISQLRKNGNHNMEIGIISLSPLIFSPHLEVHHLILTLFTQIIIIHYLWLNNQGGKLLTLIRVFSLLAFSIFTIREFWTAIGEHFVGLMIIFITIILITKDISKSSINKKFLA
jgi:hypothetical protein